MQRTIRTLTTLTLALGLLGLAAACSTNDEATSCATHSECDRGSYCSLDGKCIETACTSLGDCEGVGVVCLADLGFCSAKECDTDPECVANTAFGEGYICQAGTCILDTPGTEDVVDGGGTEQPDVKPIEDVPDVNATQCMTCTEDEECGDMSCEQVGLDKACVKTCTNDADCDAGWLCYPLTNEGKFCIPNSSQCTATCLSEGCETGQVCDQVDGSETFGQCIPALAQCAECIYDWECGAGSRCMTTNAAMKFCMPECYDGTCDDWATCGEMGGTGGEGVMVCKPNNATCCGPDDVCGGTCTPECDGHTPICLDGLCVQCVEDADCPNASDTCDPMTHVCQGLCSGGTPYELNGSCVECLEDSHCAGTDNLCVDNACSLSDPCGNACVAPYPGCAVINGVPSCVPCTEDAHCAPATCDLTTYLCDVPNPGENCAQNCLINGCPMDTQYDLQCDPESGCCFDKAGLCDNTVAFCNAAANSECKSIFEIFAGGMMGGMPGMPEDEFVGGMCTCDAASAAVCNLLPNNPMCDNAVLCFDGPSCLPIGTIVSLLTGTSGQVLLMGDFCSSPLF